MLTIRITAPTLDEAKAAAFDVSAALSHYEAVKTTVQSLASGRQITMQFQEPD